MSEEHDSGLNYFTREVAEEMRPSIVCLCGSTRFGQAFEEANLRETLQGRIVLSIASTTRNDDQLFGHLSGAEREALFRRLAALHFEKIQLADEVLVLNVGGYVGEATQREVAYALALGKPVRYWEPQAID